MVVQPFQRQISPQCRRVIEGKFSSVEDKTRLDFASILRRLTAEGQTALLVLDQLRREDGKRKRGKEGGGNEKQQ